MGRRRVTLLAALAAAWAAGAVVAAVRPATATAAPVLVLDRGGRTIASQDPYLTTPALNPAPSLPVLTRAVARKAAGPSVLSVLSRLRRTGWITPGAYRSYAASYQTAAATAKRLRGTRARELAAVLANVRLIAVTRQLTPSRLPAVFLTLDRNRQWWTTGALLSAAERVEFAGSEVVWQYYPGQGIELQVLGTFGKADGLYTAGLADYPRLRALLDEMVPLAAARGGGPAWEYYFRFDGGLPPWTSAMSQGTAIEALTRGFKATGQRSYLALAHRALAIFRAPPPAGVRLTTGVGARYLQYTFAPSVSIINAFLQSLIGLYDYAAVSGDPQAARLFAAGDAEARAELPRFDTGAWSLYQPGIEDDLSYHELVTGFLEQLCSRTNASAYCTTAQRFTDYMAVPPALSLITQSVHKGKPVILSFQLSKYSHVGIVVALGSRTVYLTSAYFTYGVAAFRVPPLGRPGDYTVRLAATDLAGNSGRVVGTLHVA